MTYDVFKRSLDLFVASAIGLACSPLAAVVALVVRLTDGGPALYRGQRVGRHGVPFDMLKFRTMVVGADRLGGPSTAADDQRITRIGRWLRRTKLDELPQLLNVLRGDMSLVGPRPQVQADVDRYSDEERILLSVRPGITDWASIRFRDEGGILAGHADPDEAYDRLIRPEKMELGLKYVREASIRTDLAVLLATVRALLRSGSQAGTNPDDRREQNDEVVAVEDRKHVEAALHDHLRGADAPAEDLENKKWYAISDLNEEFVHGWLAERIRDADVLDYCCGNGDFSTWLASNGARSVGIDISPVSVDNARRRIAELGLEDRASFAVMDAEAMDFPEGTFDVIVVHGVLHHLDLDRAYSELARVLRDGGAVIATEALRHNKLIHRYRKRTPSMRSEWEVDHILGRPEIEQAERHFDDVRLLRTFHLLSIAAVPLRSTKLFRPALAVLRGVDRVLLQLPWVRYQAWMGVFVLQRPKRNR